MEQSVSAVILAAGLSGRMGRTKQLLPLGEKPVIRHVVDALLAAPLNRIVAVVSNADNDVARSLAELPVTIAVNEKEGSDMAESVRTGLAATGSCTGILVCLSDHPLVRPETLEALVAEHLSVPDKIIIPCFEERRGHPTLFPKSLLQDLRDGVTLRDIVRKDPHRVVEIDTGDEGVVLDMDTPEEYHRIVEKMRKKRH